jgi:hypothetical protein
MTGYFVAAGVVITTGLILDWKLLPRPSTVAAAPALLAFDIAERQADEERYERLVTAIRLRNVAFEREDAETNERSTGSKEVPVAFTLAERGVKRWGEQ